MKEEEIVIVDENDACVGSMEKLFVHKNGILHRAFSVVLFDEEGNMLIQKRSGIKYHSAMLWSNACCSHQRAGESMKEAVRRGLYDELRIAVDLTESFVFHYRCECGNSLVENEIDHVFVGNYFRKPIDFNTDEIEEIRWVGIDEILKGMQAGNSFTYWFKIIVDTIGGYGINSKGIS